MRNHLSVASGRFIVIKHRRPWITTLLLLTLAVVSPSFSAADEIRDNKIDFVSQVKPILSDNCFACHGPDEAQRKTDFRLDRKESALATEYSVIVPGDVEASQMVRRILSKDPDTVMPPSDHRKHLTDAQKQILVDWVRQGAEWSEHWSFVTPHRKDIPSVVDDKWPLGEIDHYILSKLEAKNIRPSPVADPQTLLRRTSFDLTGLPPTIDELREFQSDVEASGTDVAFEKAVDRLLASPHFGERMAVYWLDLVRYADTVGYHGDQNVGISPYRDYVINAFNSNKPFDQFTREQLAGDLLEHPTQEQLIASGYNRLGMMSAEGGVQPEEYLNKYASDRVRTTSSVWLGVTLGCAECHDHKFDPFSTREFYEFSAFFADIKEQGLYAGAHETGKWGPSLDVPDDELAGLVEPIDAKLKILQASLLETGTSKPNRIQWENSIRAGVFAWNPLEPTKFQSVGNAEYKQLDDRSLLISGTNPDTETYVITASVDSGTRSVRLEAIPDDSLPQTGSGRAGNGNFVVTEMLIIPGDLADRFDELQHDYANWPEDLKQKAVSPQNPTATFEQSTGANKHPDKKWSANSAFDQNQHGKNWGWAILPDVTRPQELVIQLAEGHQLDGPTTFVIQQHHGNGSHTLGRFRLSTCPDQNATSDPLRNLPEDIRTLVTQGNEDRSPADTQQVAAYYAQVAPEFAETNQQIANLIKQRDELVKSHTRSTLITEAVPPREIRVLPRGNWMDKSGPVVQPGVPQVLGERKWDARPTRLDLANWIVDKHNPETARVFVNRMWRIFFGNGISNVLDDLGSQGEPPTHAELLDYLAIEFMENDWNIKSLIRSLVMSQTYRQSSSLRADLKTVDPENRLLARQARFRLDAEFVRDHALATSDLLVREIGGRSVFPYQPVGLYRHLNFPTREYAPSSGPDQHRRGLYTHWQRQYLHPAMKTFDAPPREECTAARPRSSTPLAALVLLNDPSYVEAARALATHAMQAAPGTAERLNWIFQTAFARPISQEESEILAELLTEHTDFFQANPDKAKEFLAVGEFKSELDAEDAELAGWTSVCRAVINMHEFVLRK